MSENANIYIFLFMLSRNRHDMHKICRNVYFKVWERSAVMPKTCKCQRRDGICRPQGVISESNTAASV